MVRICRSIFRNHYGGSNLQDSNGVLGYITMYYAYTFKFDHYLHTLLFENSIKKVSLNYIISYFSYS